LTNDRLARDSSLRTLDTRLLIVIQFVAALPSPQVSFMPSLKARFDMGPKDFGAFMGVVGFVYACSQFVVAKPVIAWSAARGEWASLRVLLLCLIGMGAGRLLAFYTHTVELVGVGIIAVRSACCIAQLYNLQYYPYLVLRTLSISS
jgi:hypothetical protein